MPNLYFRAKSLWEHGHQERGFALLHDHLKAALRREVFLTPEYILRAAPGFFETALHIFLTAAMPMSAQTILQAPLCRVLVELWKLDPSETLLLVLRHYDFFVPPSEGLTDIGEKYAPPQNDESDFAALIETLAASAQDGLLGGERTAQPGRAILTLAEIDEVPDRKWGSLKPRLRRRLRVALDAAPENPWPGLVERDTLGVVERFLQHLFARHQSPISAALVTWKLVADRHPAYATAATAALARVLSGGKQTLLDELVQIDAGRLHVSDGAAWLRALAAGLERRDFSALT